MNTLKKKFEIRKKALYMYMGFFSCMALATSCDEKTFSNADAIPEVDNINTFAWNADDFTINHKAVDSLWTNDNDYPLASVGKIESDPFFGKTNAGLYIQFSTPELGFKFGDDLIIDSSVFYLPYFVPANNTDNKIFYGDTSKAMTFNIHPITGEFKFENGRKYYAHNAVAFDPQPLAQKTIQLNEVFDTVTYWGGVTTQNLLSVKLPQTFAQNLATLDFTDVIQFQQSFPGFYVGAPASSAMDALAIFNINDGTRSNFAMAQIVVYYRNGSDTTHKNVVFPYRYSNSSWFNAITRNHNGVPAQNYLSATQSDSIVIQSAPGIGSIIEIPIDRIPNAIVNKAELVLTVQNVGAENLFLPPTQLSIKGIDDDGNEYNVADFYPSNGFEYIGGAAKIEQHNNENVIRYRLTIPREIQKLRDEGKSVVRLKVTSTVSRPGFYRTVLHGPNKEAGLRPAFNVIYSLK